MPVLSPDMVRVTGKSWPSVRVAAATRVAAAPLPTPDAEHWRYSRIDELDLQSFAPAESASTVTGGDESVVITRVGPSAESSASLGEGLFPTDIDDIELFAALNIAHMDVVHVSVPANKVVAGPVVITHRLSGNGYAFFPRVIVEAGRNSEITIVERFVSADEDRILVVPVLDVQIGRAHV